MFWQVIIEHITEVTVKTALNQSLIRNLFDIEIKRKSSALDFTVKSCLDLTIDLKSVVKSIIDSTRFFAVSFNIQRAFLNVFKLWTR